MVFNQFVLLQNEKLRRLRMKRRSEPQHVCYRGRNSRKASSDPAATQRWRLSTPELLPDCFWPAGGVVTPSLTRRARIRRAVCRWLLLSVTAWFVRKLINLSLEGGKPASPGLNLLSSLSSFPALIFSTPALIFFNSRFDLFFFLNESFSGPLWMFWRPQRLWSSRCSHSI